MKILFINSVVDYGSTGKIVRDLANGAKAQGHEVLIIYGRHDTKNESDTFSLVDNKSTMFHGLMSLFFGRHGLHSKKQTQKLISEIEIFQPDVIHLHNIHGYYLNVPMLFEYLKKKNIKILWTLHDAWSFSGSSAYFDYYGCKIWDDGCVECNSTKDYPKTFAKYRQKKNFAWKKQSFRGLSDMTIITPSDWLSEMAKTTFLKEYPIKTIHNGIDLGVFKPTKSDIRKKYGLEDKFVILGVASFWENRKGLKYFIEFADHLEEDEVIFLIGIDEKDKKKLPDEILTISRTDNVEELVKIYSAADLLLNPTLEDNYPTINLEAIACGTPVITFDTGGSPESINDQTGVVCRNKTVKSIVESVATMRLNKLNLKNNCVNYAKAHFNKNIFIERSLEEYTK